jgi:hypothetical protein
VQQEDTTAKLEAFLDGTSLGTSVQTHSAGSGTVTIFKAGLQFTSRQTSFVHYGSKLTAGQHVALSKALYTFQTTIGVRPKAGYLGLSTGPTNVAPYKHVPMGDGIRSIIVPVTPQWSGYPQGHGPGTYPYSLIKVNDPNYSSLWRMEVHQGDGQAAWDGVPSPLNRVHLSSTTVNFNFQTTVDLAFSFFIEPGSHLGDNSHFVTLMQIHDSLGGTVSPGPFSALTVAGDPHGGGQYYVWGFHALTGTNINNRPSICFPCAQGVWHHVRTTFRFDYSPNAFIQSWFAYYPNGFAMECSRA